MSERPPHLAPLTDEILRLALRGLTLPGSPRALDLCCGNGATCLLLAEELGAICTGVDLSEELLRVGRERALAAGLQDRIELRREDARHVPLQNASFDLVLALGGALTYVGRPEGLERIRQLLKPGGCVLISDLVTLDSPVPQEIAGALEEKAPENEIAPLRLEPAVRAVFEEGMYRYENEETYRELLQSLGYRVEFAFPVPESAWHGYYRFAARSLREPLAATEGSRIPVGADELAAFYSWGGRWGYAYLILGARVA
ncbi:MAG: methyltransferase domain-containing protein [Candidatus Eisenbacteria bacterium]|nr:methyltransferase domain-containing protein [Candidatus Latescibacterota bacterium]MBD3301351.1 methyltransferase domain-containing protein [Candidatus Eisenbacteria bacterium]